MRTVRQGKCGPTSQEVDRKKRVAMPQLWLRCAENQWVSPHDML